MSPGSVMAAEDQLAAFRQVCRISEAHYTVLDRALAIMQDGAWLGGGAAAFTGRLAGVRHSIQGALTDAVAAAVRAAAQAGASPAVPALTAAAPAPAPAWPRGQLVGFRAEAAAALAGELRNAALALAGAAAALSAQLTRVGASTAPAAAVARAGHWADQAAGDLARRLGTLEHRAGAGRPSRAVASSVLFGHYSPGGAGAAPRMQAAAAGDITALAALLQMLRTGADRGLVGSLSSWWQTVPLTMRRRLTEEDPGVVGALDGLPATVRDQANRAYLADLHPALTAEQASLRRAAGECAQLARVTGLLQGLDALRARLGEPGTGARGLPAVYLLGIDAVGRGHAVVSFGNPDTARNVVTYVPGLGARLSGVAADLTRAARLWAQAHFADPQARTASICWLGYDAPQPAGGGGPAADPRASAILLDTFCRGLAAARTSAMAAHAVLLGHSHGAVVAAEAVTRAPGPLADDVIFTGPEACAAGIEQLRMNGQRVWPGHELWDDIPGPRSCWDVGSPALITMARIVAGHHSQVPLTQAGRPPALVPAVPPVRQS
jgi:Alpha/beta hydrolase